MTGPARISIPGDRLVVASHNAGKVREIADLVRPLGLGTISAVELGLPEPEETGATYEENAALKAEAAAARALRPALADDSGLSVDALGGAPGVFSARWAGHPRDFRAGALKIQTALAKAHARGPFRARFVCVLALAAPGEATRLWRGEVEGRLVFPGRGTRGFGYDPIFTPDGRALTFGEMEPADKHAMSHRARAFAKMLADLRR